MLFLLTACATGVTFETPIPVDDTFERAAAPPDLQARIEEAAAYSEAHGGRAFMVLLGDQVVYEAGQNGHTLDQPHPLYSGTKSFTCALYEALHQQDGLTADDTLDLQRPATVEQLLHLTSGIDQDPRRLSWDPMRKNPRTEDIYAETLAQPQSTDPGDRFTYGASHFNAFGALVTERYGDPLDLLEARVFGPIGMRTAGWLRDPSGNPTLSLGAFTTANEWAKFGVLVRDNGVFLGEQVLEPGLHDCFEGSSANPAYGRSFWLNQAIDDDVEVPARRRMEAEGPLLSNLGPSDLVAAAGYDDQRLYIVQSHDLVIVRLSNGHRSFKDHEQLAPFFQN